MALFVPRRMTSHHVHAELSWLPVHRSGERVERAAEVELCLQLLGHLLLARGGFGDADVDISDRDLLWALLRVVAVRICLWVPVEDVENFVEGGQAEAFAFDLHARKLGVRSHHLHLALLDGALGREHHLLDHSFFLEHTALTTGGFHLDLRGRVSRPDKLHRARVHRGGEACVRAELAGCVLYADRLGGTVEAADVGTALEGDRPGVRHCLAEQGRVEVRATEGNTVDDCAIAEHGLVRDLRARWVEAGVIDMDAFDDGVLREWYCECEAL